MDYFEGEDYEPLKEVGEDGKEIEHSLEDTSSETSEDFDSQTLYNELQNQMKQIKFNLKSVITSNEESKKKSLDGQVVLYDDAQIDNYLKNLKIQKLGEIKTLYEVRDEERKVKKVQKKEQIVQNRKEFGRPNAFGKRQNNQYQGNQSRKRGNGESNEFRGPNKQ